MNVDDEEIPCAEMWKLTQEKKYDEIVQHVLGACMKCITNPKKRFNGQEMLFPDAPPPWIKIPETEKKNPQAWKKYEKKKVHVQMSPEEFDQFLIDSDLGDEAMTHEIAKFKRVERHAAWPIMREIRKKQREIQISREKEKKESDKKEVAAKKEAEKLKKLDEKWKSQEAKKQKNEDKLEYLEKINEVEKFLDEGDGDGDGDGDGGQEEQEEVENPAEKKEKEKFVNLKSDLPWCPSLFDLLCSENRSIIDHEVQRRILAMCQNLMYHGELQHNSNKRELKDMFKAAEPEYDTLAAAALEHARNETIHPIDYVSEKTLKFALHSFNRKAPPPANYLVKNPVFTIAEIDTPEGIQTEKQANPPKFEKLLKKPGWMDELEIPNMRRKCGIFKNKRLPALKVPLPDDKIATSLIELQDTVSVMMDATTIAHFLAPRWLGIEYDFGIPVKVVETMVNGKSKKIVTLSKPIPYGTISKSTVQRKTLKRMLKNQYVKLSEKCAQITTKFPENNAPETPADDPAIPSTSADTGDFLDDLIAGMDKTTTNSKEETTPTVETGYQYAVFSVGETKVVVRSRPPYSAKDLGDNKHDVLAKLPRISFEPRVEYLPNGGAMDLERSEWVWNYAKKVFKMSDAHLLYRCSYRADHVLQVDTMTMQPQLTPPPPGVWALLTARTVMLEQLISRLETLETGEYLAFQEKSKPLVVVPKSPDPSQGISTGVLKITENEVVSLGESIGNAYFHGFCQEVVFQWQIVQGRAPRMLLAKDSPLVKRLPSRTNREKLERHKNETKRKFVRREDEKNYVKRQRMPDLDDPNLYADFTNPAILQQSYNPQAERRGRGRGRGGGGRGRGGRGKRGGRGRGGNGGSL